MNSDNDLVEEWLNRIPAGRYAADIVNIFKYISTNEKVIFQSQQIDDPELSRSERYLLAELCYMRSRQTFLIRFGPYLEEEHLRAFAQYAICEGSAPELGIHENYEEMQLLLRDFHKKLQKKKQIIKNRRYAFMQKMLKEGDEYFSEQEMMRREPELYQELVGQYLSHTEKEERDSYDVRNTTISDILMHTIEQERIRGLLENADEKNKSTAITDIDENSQFNIAERKKQPENIQICKENHSEEDEDESESFGQQWGNFDNEQVPCSSAKRRKTESEIKKHIPNSLRENKSRNVLITASERKLLRQEFVSIMKEKFLNGKDDQFDYNTVDYDSDQDDLDQINQDAEDAYFAEDNSDDDTDPLYNVYRYLHDNFNYAEDSDDDDLEIFMNQLSQHLQN